MLRKIVAVVLGSLAAVLVITVVQQLGMTVSPLPVGIDISDPSAIEPGDIPLINMLWVLASYALGVLTGGAAAGRISPAFVPVGPLIIGGLLTVASIMNMTMIPAIPISPTIENSDIGIPQSQWPQIAPISPNGMTDITTSGRVQWAKIQASVR